MKINAIIKTSEHRIATDSKSLFTVASFVSILLIFINAFTIKSVIVGSTFTAIYFLINATFLGNTFFKEEASFLRFGLGGLLLITLLGLVGWIVLILCNLDTIRSMVVLCTVSVISAIANRMRRYTFIIEFGKDPSSA